MPCPAVSGFASDGVDMTILSSGSSWAASLEGVVARHCWGWNCMPEIFAERAAHLAMVDVGTLSVLGLVHTNTLHGLS